MITCPVIVDGAVVPCGTGINITSPNIISDGATERITKHVHQDSRVTVTQAGLSVTVNAPEVYHVKTDKTRPEKLGLMLVGWGGNNGSTLTAALLANNLGLAWETRRGSQAANFLGSLVMSSTVPLGKDADGRDVVVRMHDLVPFARPEAIVIGGWDISSMSLGDALTRSRVLEPDLIRQVKPHLEGMMPLPSIYDPAFIASNQADRADNCLTGPKLAQLDQICFDIEQFKRTHGLDRVIVMWTANTERQCQVLPGVHDTYKNLKKAILDDHPEVSPSTIFAMASILCRCPFINGSPQNTFVPAILELSASMGIPVAGDDFKSGQTKVKSVLVDFLVTSGIKPLSIVSYNHLGNNDGKNLAEAAQFRSKELSKSNVIDDMIASNPVLFPMDDKNKGPDHKVVIEYVPAVGDSKRAMDEYESEIFMGGRNTIIMHNTCEDSLLAAPLMLDLALLMEFLMRVQVSRRQDLDGELEWEPLHPVMSLLAFCLKAPLHPQGVPIVNALARQRRAIETLLRISAGLPPTDDLALPTRLRPE